MRYKSLLLVLLVLACWPSSVDGIETGPEPPGKKRRWEINKKAVVVACRSTVEERRRRRAARTAMSPGMKPAQTVTPLNSQPPPVRPHATRLSARAATYPQSTKPQQQKMHVHSGVRACNRRTGVYIRPKPQHTQRKKWGGGEATHGKPPNSQPRQCGRTQLALLRALRLAHHSTKSQQK